jgi:hypothetical protein
MVKATRLSLFLLALAAFGALWQGRPVTAQTAGKQPGRTAADKRPAPATPQTKPSPKPSPISVEPAQFELVGKWAAQRLLVTGQLPDGTSRDLTSKAQFTSANPQIAAVSKAGIVTPRSDGETTIKVVVPASALAVAASRAKQAPPASPRATVQVSVKDSRSTAASFTNQIRPVLARLGCNATECHGAQRGQGGLKLSLFGGDPGSDFEALTKQADGRRINRVEPLKSLLWLKATGELPHQGARRLPPGSAEYEMMVSWLSRGAPWAAEKEPQIVSIKVIPAERVLQKGETQQLLATAVLSDGSQKDITQDAVYRSSDAKVAAVAAGGLVKANDCGEAIVAASYLRQSAVVRLTVPQPLAKPFPALQANNQIDELVYAKLKRLGIPPSDICSDPEFLRRVYLDVIGILPAAEEARAFLADHDPNKRGKLIDRLLERDEFADFWALKWGDLLRIKSEYPVRLWPKAVAVYYRWVRESIAQNKPYDRFARELITANGSNFRNAPANFLRAVQNKDPQTIGETAALVFMGARLGCARCHGHPTETWSLDDDLGFGAFFAQVSFKNTLEWKEEIVYPDPRHTLRHPKTRQVVKPKFLGGPAAEAGNEEDPRGKLADWLASPQNPWFGANIVNRIWFWLMGRGIVHEPDDLRPTNPPENPELLDYLQKELVSDNYDLKHVFRLILNSRVYQLSSKSNQWNANDKAHFSHYTVKRLTAEQMLDAVSQVTETYEKFRSIIPEPYSNWPAGYRATQLSDGNMECGFLDLFGRPPRDTPYEEERRSDASLRQELYLVNSEQMEAKVSGSPRFKRLLAANKGDAETVEELYLMTLSRFPSEQEKQTLVDYLAKHKSTRAQAVQDLAWAVMNAKEFIFNH